MPKPESSAKQPTTKIDATPAMRDNPTMLGELKIGPVSVGTFLLLETIDSPFMPGKEAAADMKDIAAAVLILTDPVGARAALATSRAEFDRLAFAAASRVPITDLTKLAAILTKARHQ